MEESILNTIKKMLGIDDTDYSFDIDIVTHINSTFGALTQIGVGPEEGFYIEGDNSKWEDFLDEATNLEMVKSYMYFSVRKMFDPPQSSATMQALNDNLNQLEWRISVTVDPGEEE